MAVSIRLPRVVTVAGPVTSAVFWNQIERSGVLVWNGSPGSPVELALLVSISPLVGHSTVGDPMSSLAGRANAHCRPILPSAALTPLTAKKYFCPATAVK